MFKASIIKDIQSTNCTMRLWDYCVDRREKINIFTPRNLFQLNGNTHTVATHCAQGDISNIFRFGCFNWCYFQEEGKVEFPLQNELLGRVLGPMKN